MYAYTFPPELYGSVICFPLELAIASPVPLQCMRPLPLFRSPHCIVSSIFPLPSEYHLLLPVISSHRRSHPSPSPTPLHPPYVASPLTTFLTLDSDSSFVLTTGTLFVLPTGIAFYSLLEPALPLVEQIVALVELYILRPAYDQTFDFFATVLFIHNDDFRFQ
ncbi:hypothetical protein BDQ17DRAFT_1434039 [Cyathus striatus]|nr:hypothetical protein BDQ17DRAFT_1434039 [Cyathus striatus]